MFQEHRRPIQQARSPNICIQDQAEAGPFDDSLNKIHLDLATFDGSEQNQNLKIT